MEGEYKWLLCAIPAHCLLVERLLAGIKCKHETTGPESLKEMSLGRLHDAEWDPDFRVTTFCQIMNESWNGLKIAPILCLPQRDYRPVQNRPPTIFSG